MLREGAIHGECMSAASAVEDHRVGGGFGGWIHSGVSDCELLVATRFDTPNSPSVKQIFSLGAFDAGQRPGLSDQESERRFGPYGLEWSVSRAGSLSPPRRRRAGERASGRQRAGAISFRVRPESKHARARLLIGHRYIVGRQLAAVPGPGHEAHVLPFAESSEARALVGGNVHEDVLRAVLRLVEPVAVRLREPLDGPGLEVRAGAMPGRRWWLQRPRGPRPKALCRGLVGS